MSRGRRLGATGPLVNIGLLERELGEVEYRLWKGGDRAALEAHKQALLARLDEEHRRLA